MAPTNYADGSRPPTRTERIALILKAMATPCPECGSFGDVILNSRGQVDRCRSCGLSFDVT